MAPLITVVVPAFERPAALAGCLQSLAAQTVGASRFEVIVCDDGSRAPASSELAAVVNASADVIDVRLLRQRNSGPATARNRGAAAARGEYVAFTDDDCRPAPAWLERLLDTFAAHPDALIGGGLRTTAQSDRYARAMQAIMDFVYADQERRGGLRLFSTSNLALPLRGFRALDGFSATFRRAAGEDYDLCARWHCGGGRIAYVPDAVVVHDHALTLREYWLQHYTYGRGLLHMRRRLSSIGLDLRRERREPANGTPGGFYLRLVLSPIAARGPRGAGSATLIALSQAATAAGALRELLKPDPRPPGGLKSVRESA